MFPFALEQHEVGAAVCVGVETAVGDVEVWQVAARVGVADDGPGRAARHEVGIGAPDSGEVTGVVVRPLKAVGALVRHGAAEPDRPTSAGHAELLAMRRGAAALGAPRETQRAFTPLGEHVDHATDCLRPVQCAAGPPQHLDAVDVVGGQVPEVELSDRGRVDLDPVEQHQHLVRRGAADRRKGGAARRAEGGDIHARHPAQRLGGSRLVTLFDLRAGHDRHGARHVVRRRLSPRRRDDDVGKGRHGIVGPNRHRRERHDAPEHVPSGPVGHNLHPRLTKRRRILLDATRPDNEQPHHLDPWQPRVGQSRLSHAQASELPRQERAIMSPAAPSKRTMVTTPPPATLLDTDRHPHDRLPRTLSLTDATMLVVSSVIGVGIFLTPGTVADALPQPGPVPRGLGRSAALLSLAGALANAELGAMYPHAGGDYVYLREAYHPVAGLPGRLAVVLRDLRRHRGDAGGRLRRRRSRTSSPLGAGAQASAVAVGDHRSPPRRSTTSACAPARAVNNVTAVLKIAALRRRWSSSARCSGGGDVRATCSRWSAGRARCRSPAFGLALSPVLFSYLGWNASVYVASEIRDPQRNVPRSLFLGLGVCTAIYLALNVALPLRAADRRAARRGARRRGGGARPLRRRRRHDRRGARPGSILGCLNATILVGPRIAYAMALDGLFFRRRRPRARVATRRRTSRSRVQARRRSR